VGRRATAYDAGVTERTDAPTPRPGWGWSLASASLAVGFVAIFFPVAPFWCLVWLAIIALVLRLTPVGSRLVQRERSALLSGLAASPHVTERPRLVAVLAFLPVPIIAGSLAWDLSDPSDLWNGGILFVAAMFGFLVWTVVQELRGAGQPARWWAPWVVLTSLLGAFFLVGGPSRVRWAYCEDRLTRVVAAGGDVTEANTGSACWHDAVQREEDGQVRLYLEMGEPDGSGGEGLVYSPDRSVEQAGGLRELIDLGGGWYWFETGSPVRSFWFDG